MTTKSAVSPKIDKRGTNPKSLANLRPPWKPGEQPNSGNPYPVSRHLKDILSEKEKVDRRLNGRIIAEKMVERAKILTGKSDAAILSQLLDRTEGKVPEPHLVAGVIDVVFRIGKGYIDRFQGSEIKELTQGGE